MPDTLVAKWICTVIAICFGISPGSHNSPDPHRLIDTGLPRIEDLNVRLSYQERIKLAMLTIRIDLGPAPDVAHEALWRALLADNIVRARQPHPHEKRIVQVARHPLTREMTARMLSETLLRKVQTARRDLASVLESLARKLPEFEGNIWRRER